MRTNWSWLIYLTTQASTNGLDTIELYEYELMLHKSAETREQSIYKNGNYVGMF